MDATKKMCGFILKVENFSKSYFRKGQNYSKAEHPEIFGVITLQNLSKLNMYIIYINLYMYMYIYIYIYQYVYNILRIKNTLFEP